MRKWIFLGMIGFVFSAEATNLRVTMKDSALSLESLLVSSQDLSAYSKDEKVLLYLAGLKKALQDNESHFKARTSDWQLNHRTLKVMVEEAHDAYVSKRYEMSRQMVRSIPGLCMSCHTQDNFHAMTFKKPLSNEIGLLDKAEFAFATRRPEEAQLALLSFFKVNNSSSEDVLRGLRRQLQLWIWQSKNWDDMTSGFKNLKSQYASSPEAVRFIDGWLDGVQKSKKNFSKPLSNIYQIPKLVKKVFGDENPALGLVASPSDEVFFLKLGQELHKLLSKTKGSDQGWVLYWLAWAERGVSYNFYYSLADGYLKTCMDEWPKSPVAKRCYGEYESFIEFAYSGSAGTDIPPDIQQELKNYRLKLGVKQ